MNFHVLPARRLCGSERKFIVDHLSRPGSDFQKSLLDSTQKGSIAICLDHGEIIGWARTEEWHGLPTLEAFVATAYRRRGVAKACASCLLAEGSLARDVRTAVFTKQMTALAEKLGMLWSQFDRKPDGTWKPA
jgi:hypothetical protein